ncbi:MAG: cobyrinate a,c-diamide synthase [Ruminococcus sp.]|nr:cobyrinate a,c-diamide synthase [Ruminococcus sp.]
MRRVIIAGTGSGCGKTTVTCAVMEALCRRGMKLSSFKCGPDYIDPMFHEKIIGTYSHNLDSFFCDENTVKYLLYENGINSDISVIEGVMGFYDGVNGKGSALSVAEITDTPVILVVDCKGMSNSLGAVVKGFLTYRTPNNICGIIFNRLPEKLVSCAKKICAELNTVYFGYMPSHKCTIESRHLGLVTADEISDIKEKIKFLGELAEKDILLDKIINYSERPFPKFTEINIEKMFENPPVVAVARDRAFCFLYKDNVSLMENIGCRIKYFSTLYDERVPEDADGLILCGGYPELYLERLSENISMCESVKSLVNVGIPVIAECGGFMYLHKYIENNNETYQMTDVFESSVYRTDRLQRFGYITLESESDSLLFKKGDKITAHEFHYWESTDCGKSLTAVKHDGRSWECCRCSESMYAGFPHIYFYSDIRMAERFAVACAEYGGKKWTE